jgi:DNA polymerase-3 subunit beta
MMRASVDVKALQRFLRAAGAVVDKKASKVMPALGCVLLEAREGVLALTATDMEVEVREKLPAGLGELSPGRVAIPLQLLVACAKGNKARVVTLTEIENNVTVCEFEGWGRWELHGLDPDLFQTYQVNPDAQPGPIQAVTVDDLDFIREAVSVDPTRYNLNGFYVDDHCLVSTDGHRLHQANHRDYQDAGFIVPAKVALVACRMARDYRVESVDLKRRGTAIGFRIGTLTGTASLMDGEFPDYTQVIPSHQKIQIEIPDSVAFAAVIAQAGCQASERTQGIKLGVNGGGMVVSASNPDTGEFKSMAPTGEITGWTCLKPDFVAGFDAQYLTEALSHLDGAVTLSLDDDLSPCVLEGGDRKAIVMPMRI